MSSWCQNDSKILIRWLDGMLTQLKVSLAQSNFWALIPKLRTEQDGNTTDVLLILDSINIPFIDHHYFESNNIE